MSIPVSHHETLKPEPSLQYVGEQIVVGMHLHAVPAVIRSHDDQSAGFDRGRVPRAMHRTELCLGNDGIALIPSAPGSAVAEKMLDRRQRAAGRHELRRAALPLKSRDHGRGVLGDQFR